MSGREFSIKKCQKYQSGYNIVSNNDRVSQVRLYFLSLLYDFFCFIQEVRNLRPWSIETTEQEMAVLNYNKRKFKEEF